MAQIIVIQPDGKFSLWSTFFDEWFMVDLDEEDVIKYFEDKDRKRSIESTKEVIEELKAGGKPYPFAQTWEELNEIAKTTEAEENA